MCFIVCGFDYWFTVLDFCIFEQTLLFVLNVYIIQFRKLFLKPQYKKERRVIAQ